MPGCILEVTGVEFNPDKFLVNSTLRPYKVWHRGEALAVKGPRAERAHEWSGFRCDVSEVDGELSGQIADAIQFLIAHRADLERLVNLVEVEDCRLDFGYICRLNDDIVIQAENLPVEFLELVGQLQIAVALSLYQPRLADKPEST